MINAVSERKIEIENARQARRTEAYQSEDSKSFALHNRGREAMAGGNSRLSIALSPYPVYVKSGKGCRVTDVEGEERLDFLNNFTSLILGHADPIVAKSVHDQVDLGASFAMPTEVEIELAELLCGRVGYIDQIRFCNSGTEGVMLAIKAARAFTGRPKIAKFEGAYHGTYDFAAVSFTPSPDYWGTENAPRAVGEPGSPDGVAASVVVLPFNDIEAAEALIKQNKDDLAAVLIDPMPGAINMVEATPEYLTKLRSLTRQYGILMISDEVMSFRVAFDGALAASGVDADLTALGKIIGGGYPIGAVAGSREVMEVFDQNKQLKVKHGGTFNANPVTMVAGLETMKQMTRHAFDDLAQKGDYLRSRMRRMFERRDVQTQINGRGSLFAGTIASGPIRNYRDIVRNAHNSEFNIRLCHEMLRRGIITSNRGVFGCLSTPMQEPELNAFLDAFEGSLTTIGVFSR